METYDVIVIGGGSGASVAEQAVDRRLKVAVVDRGPAGGTCLNLGCIPSKMLIYAADRVVEIQEAAKLGIAAGVTKVDFRAIMERMRKNIDPTREEIRQWRLGSKNPRFYEGQGRFTGDYSIEVNGERLTARQVFIASGSRPLTPPLKGLDSVPYLTNETVLQLAERPESLIIIGGGYIAVEYGHFFAAMGSRVTMLEMADRLVTAEEPELSDLLKKALGKRLEIHTGVEALSVARQKDGVTVTVRDRKSGQQQDFTAAALMMAVGRRSNADTLNVDKAGVELDKRGFVRVDEYLETTRKNIWAIGDANGQQMFTHVANREAMVAAHNAFEKSRMKMDYGAAPHAVFSHPQIASVGLTQEAAAKYHEILVGRTTYSDTAKGEAMMESEGFAKAIVEKGSGKILGFHIIGPYAPELIQEVTNAMASGGHIKDIYAGIHIHPALSELIPDTIGSLEEPGP
ncbi:MAG: dihydrolipoyl dehydrogenase [Chloroflexi bacterium]|nr:dihydrolipoyl dehydrogenase [Chloroflexota bacterium]